MAWLKRILAIVVVVAVLGGAAEIALRMIIPNVIADTIRTELQLTDDHPVDVKLGGSALLPALVGRVGEVSVSVPDAPLIEGLTADARVTASSSPFDPSTGEIENAAVTLTLSPEQLSAVLALLTNGVAETGEVSGGSLVVGRNLEVFGQDVPLSATLMLEVLENGDVRVSPEGLSAAGLDLSAEQLAQIAGPMLEPLLQPQTVCVNDRLPRGIELTAITLSSTGSVILEADLAPGILSDPQEQVLGSCTA